MSGIQDQERLEALRKRLYERGNAPSSREAHPLSPREEQSVPTQWQKPPQEAPSAPLSAPAQTYDDTPVDMSPKKVQRGYRIKILLAGIAFFVVAVGLSSLYLMFGGRGISGDNITIVATSPFTIGGGEELQIQVGVTNDNAVPIQSGTLIVEYPDGTRSVGDESKDLFVERLSLETVEPGETINVPLRVLVFGEENEEKTINVSIEYRVEGSNATFFKEADPVRFKVSSSPVVMRADTLKKISSGQETDVEVTLISNAPTPLQGVLVRAEYPTGFDFTESDPAPTYGQNMWLLDTLDPEGDTTITITGVVVGKETDEYAINFTVGVPSQGDQQTLASVFATAQTQFEIEQPFLDIDLTIDGSRESSVSVQPGKRSNVIMKMTNTLEDTLYDISVEVDLSGNAFSIYEVGPSSGYFDPSKNTITWDVSNTPLLRQAIPGEEKRLSFTIEPTGASLTPQVNIAVNVDARRVSENQVSEKLVGTANAAIKVVSVPEVTATVGHNIDIFLDRGPVPPVVDQETTYTVMLKVANGSNNITNAVVNTALPAYVTYIGEPVGAGSITYNETTRALEWAAGDIDANAEVFTAFQIAVTPRALHAGTTPTIVGEQRVRAVDQFTNEVVRDTHPAITTSLNPGRNGDTSGRVRASASN